MAAEVIEVDLVVVAAVAEDLAADAEDSEVETAEVAVDTNDHDVEFQPTYLLLQYLLYYLPVYSLKTYQPSYQNRNLLTFYNRLIRSLRVCVLYLFLFVFVL